MFTIFLHENEFSLQQILKSDLEKEGWVIQLFDDIPSDLYRTQEYPHLWIVDIRSYGSEGNLILKQIKIFTPAIPVLFISTLEVDFTNIDHLDLENDDFVIAPFHPKELLIRSKRLLKRNYPSIQKSLPIKLHPYVLYESKREALLGTERIKLTSKEFDLLLCLIKHRGKALSREQIVHQIWGTEYVGSERAADDLMRRLRKKMPELKIETLYGYGYRMTFS